MYIFLSPSFLKVTGVYMYDSITPIQEKLGVYCVQGSTGDTGDNFISKVWRDLLMALQGVDDLEASLF